jgi:hypothetical protein
MIGAGLLRNEMISTFKTFEVGALLVGGLSHICRDWTDQPITKKNAEKSSNQCGRKLVTDLFRRTSQRAHGDDDAEHRGHNS